MLAIIARFSSSSSDDGSETFVINDMYVAYSELLGASMPSLTGQVETTTLLDVPPPVVTL